jgi:DNA-binding response OmpR family regulator
MIVIVDERESVMQGFADCFSRMGVKTAGLAPAEFGQWVSGAAQEDIGAVEAFLLGAFQARRDIPGKIKHRSSAAVIALNDGRSLDETLDLFHSGVDDVIRKPVHVREIMARIQAISSRREPEKKQPAESALRVFGDGRDPEVGGKVLPLPRRELRILEYLVRNRGNRVTKTQIFNFVYGPFDEGVDENVIESHISKLRKRLRARLGADPIDSQRFLGYRLRADI